MISANRQLTLATAVFLTVVLSSIILTAASTESNATDSGDDGQWTLTPDGKYEYSFDEWTLDTDAILAGIDTSKDVIVFDKTYQLTESWSVREVGSQDTYDYTVTLDVRYSYQAMASIQFELEAYTVSVVSVDGAYSSMPIVLSSRSGLSDSSGNPAMTRITSGQIAELDTVLYLVGCGWEVEQTQTGSSQSDWEFYGIGGNDLIVSSQIAHLDVACSVDEDVLADVTFYMGQDSEVFIQSALNANVRIVSDGDVSMGFGNKAATGFVIHNVSSPPRLMSVHVSQEKYDELVEQDSRFEEFLVVDSGDDGQWTLTPDGKYEYSFDEWTLDTDAILAGIDTSKDVIVFDKTYQLTESWSVREVGSQDTYDYTVTLDVRYSYQAMASIQFELEAYTVSVVSVDGAYSSMPIVLSSRSGLSDSSGNPAMTRITSGQIAELDTVLYLVGCGWEVEQTQTGSSQSDWEFYGIGGNDLIVSSQIAHLDVACSVDEDVLADVTFYMGQDSEVFIQSALNANVRIVSDGDVSMGFGNKAATGFVIHNVSSPPRLMSVHVSQEKYDELVEQDSRFEEFLVVDSGDDGQWTLTPDGKYKYTGSDDVTSLVIPDYVTALADKACQNLTALESVTIPNTLQTIGTEAFDGCTSLRTIVFESGGTDSLTIGDDAFSGTSIGSIVLPARTVSVRDSFEGCSSLRSITFESADAYVLESFGSIDGLNLDTLHMPYPKDGNLPEGTDEIEDFKLLGTKEETDPETGIVYRLEEDGSWTIQSVPQTLPKSVTIRDGVKEIGSYAFRGRTIGSITIPVSVEVISDHAFDGATLGSVTFKEGSELTSIRTFAFSQSSLTSIDLSNCTLLTSIGNYAFSRSNLNSILLPDGLQSIGMQAFASTMLTSIQLPSSVTTIGNSAFAGSYLESMVLPSGLTSLGNTVFPNTLEELSVESGNTTYQVDGGILYRQTANGLELRYVLYNVEDATILPGTVSISTVEGFKSHTNLKTVTFGEGVTANIPNSGFLGCTSLVSIDASKASFTSIGDFACKNLENLSEFHFPTTLTTIGNEAFYGCIALHEVDLSGTSFSSGSNATFNQCTSLVRMILPSTATRVPAMGGCLNLSEIIVSADNQYLESIDNIMVIEKGEDGKELVFVVNALPVVDGRISITIPADVTSIGTGVFYEVMIDAVYVAEGNETYVSTEDGSALIADDVVVYIASGVYDCTLPGSVKEVTSRAFLYATNLRNLTWGDENTTGDFIFSASTSSVETITLTTTGKVTLGQGTTGFSSSLLSSFTVNCGEFEASSLMGIITNTIGSSVDFSIKIEADSITGSGFITENATSVRISGGVTGSQDLDVGSLFADGTYEGLEIIIDGKAADVVQTMSGHRLVVQDPDSETIQVQVERITKSGDNCTVAFTVDLGDLTVYDVDATLSDGTQLQFSDGAFIIDMSGDKTVTISEKSSDVTHTVTFDPNGGVLPSESGTVSIGDGRTISTTQLDSMTPTREGYTFKGWYLDQKLSDSYDRDRIFEDTTLYARWEPDNGVVVTLYDPYNRVTASLEDGTTFYSGDKVSPNSKLNLTFTAGNGIEFLGWNIVVGSDATTYDSYELELEVTSATQVYPDMRVYSTSNAMINITDLPTPEWENITLVWKIQYDVDTSMSTWTGMPSIPLIVDDHVYVRAADDLIKLSIETGDTIKSITTKGTTATAYYHYLGYGGGVIVDYMTQSAYDLDLNLLYKLPKAFTAVFYDGGYFYGLCDGKLWKFDADDGALVTDSGWSGGVEVSWHGIYGTTSTPVFDDGWVYFVEASGDDRMIGAVNLETGAFDRIVLDQMNAYLCDDGWLTMYEYKGTSYLFVTGYTGDLFDSGSGGDSIVMCIALNEDGTFADGSERWMKFRASAAASAFVVIDGRGYINVSQQSTEASADVGNAGGAFYVVDVHKFLDAPQSIWTDYADKVDIDLTYTAKSIAGVDGSQGGWLIYVEQSIRTHGSIVVSTAYKDDTGKVYIYLLPYTASEQALYTFCDWDGKTSASGYLKSSPVGQNYGSQAVRVGPNGELIWYTDSGTLWCVKAVSIVPYQFLIQDADGAAWVGAEGSSLKDALLTALRDYYGTDKTISESNGIITVNGASLSVYFEDGDIWIAIDAGDSEYNAYRTFFVSLTILTDEDEPLDLNQVYETYYLNEDGNVIEYNLLDIINSPPTDGYFSRTGYVTVTVDANGGTLASGTDETIVVSPGDEIEVPAKPSRFGYSFLGWDVDGNIYNTGDKITVSKSITITAKWVWADPSTRVGGVTITSDGDGFTDEPESGKWVDYIAAGYAEDSEDAYKLMNAANSGFTAEGDVADRTMFLYFSQRGTGTDSITGRLYLSDGTQIYQEAMGSTATMWYVTLSSTPNSSGSADLSRYYKLGETYTMAIYVNGEMACSVDITVPDGKVTDVTYKGSSVTMSEGETIVLKPWFYIAGTDGSYSVGSVSQKGVTWVSSNASVATVDANGNLVGVSAGTTVITVTTDDGGHVAYCYVTVEATPVTSVTIEEGSVSVSVGGGTSLTADYGGASATVSWSSSAPGVAAVDSNGNVTGVSAGTAVITVTVTDSLGNTKTANCVVTVTANLVTSIDMQGTMSLQVGGSGVLTAEVGPSTADNKVVVWSSSNSGVATVVNGVVTAVGPGTATITAIAADGSGISATCVVTVSSVSVESVTLSSSSLTLNVGGSSILTATVTPDNVADKTVVWASSNSGVATVVNGVVTAVGPGTATITVSTVDGGKTATCTVTVRGEITGIELNRSSVSMTTGDSVTLEYSLLPDGTGGYTVSWSSSDTSVVTVSNGRISAVGPGTATVTVAVGGTQLSAVCTVTVVGSSTETGTTTEENDDGSVTTTVTEEIDVGGGTSVGKVTETTSVDGSTTSTVTTYTVGTDGSKVTTTVTITYDANGSQMVAETFVPSTVSNGVRTVSPTDIRVALEQMGIADAVTGEDVSSTVTVNVSTGADVSDVRTTIPSDSVAGLSGTGMTLVTDIGSLDITGDVFSTIGDIGGDATVNISRVTGSSVPSVLDEMTGVSVFEVSLRVGGTSVHQLGGTVTMALPYALGSGQSADGVKVYYVDDSGNMTICQSSYDAEAGTVAVATDHFSTFAIVYEAPAGASDSGDDTMLLVCIAVMGAIIAVMAVMIVVMYSRGYLKKV